MTTTIKRLKIKLFILLGIIKIIDLTDNEKLWIKLLKFHYRDKYDYTGGWLQIMKTPFEEIYGWSANVYYNDYLSCMFEKLFDIYLKIQYDCSGNNVHLKDIVKASFHKSITRDQESTIERVIVELCSKIQNTQVVINGIERFKL